jgi:3-mercaptopyruvate sulfurtransferase SseA
LHLFFVRSSQFIGPIQLCILPHARKHVEKEPGSLDAPTEEAYQKGHIKGAVLLDPMKSGKLRWPWGTDTPQQLLEPETIANVFGAKGIAVEDHIVVYDDDAWKAAFLLSVLDYCGAKNISFLKGGIDTWRRSGYSISTETPVIEPKTFEVDLRPQFMVDNQFVRENLDSLGNNLLELHYLLRRYLTRAIGGVHILPFYSSSADRGFAPLT